MARRVWALLVLGVTGLGIAACLDDSSSGGGGAITIDGGPTEGGPVTDGGPTPVGPGEPPAPGSGGEFCDKTIGVVGRALESCCTASDKTTQDYGVTHGILAALEPVCASTLEASITKGRVLVHPDAVTACYAAYAATYGSGTCPNITQTFSDPAGPACVSAFSGTGAGGAPCMGDHECSDGLSCVGYTKSADGACAAPPAVGAACGAGRDDAGGGSTTLEFGSHPKCVAGARCDFVTSKCVAAGAGTTCTFDDDCGEGLRCHAGTCGTTGPSAAGATCKSKNDCVPGTFCNPSGTCETKRSAGGACTGASFETECIGRCAADAGAPGSCASFCGSP